MRTRTLVIALALALLPLSAVAGGVRLNLPDQIDEDFTLGQEFAYSLCLGQKVNVPKPGERQVSLSPAQSPCGSSANPSPTVWGGNPPYYFVLDTMGGFPPMGIFLDKNGVLRGTPKASTSGSFRVCAVDLSANQTCQRITLNLTGVEATAGQGGSGGVNPTLLLLGGAAALGGGLAAANLASTMDMTETSRCTASQTDCGDGKCCDGGYGCCGIYGGVEICCSADYPHYCASTGKCYRTMPSCDFRLCGGVIANAPGVMVGAAPAPGALHEGDPSSSSDEGVPARLGCPPR